MQISKDWLHDYLPADIPAERMAELLTATGLEVEKVHAVDAIPGGLRGVVVGKVLTTEKHPDADRLKCTTVDIGQGQPLEIVCGAPNVAVGQLVPVATVGCTLYPAGSEEGLTIKKGKIRGKVSEGMICAEDELGLGTGHDGIMVLDASAQIGQPLSTFLCLESDTAMEIGLTPNRMDAMSHMGVARDLRAALLRHDEAVVWSPPMLSEWPVVPSGVQLDIADKKACPRYFALKVDGVSTIPSPEWLQRRLKTIGAKPINALVDVTNYVLHSIGHPLHAFDAQAIDGHKIHVRHAHAGERFTTLDGVERTLHHEDLVIASADKPMALAGVFGGLHSGVQEKTTSIVLESAWFDPVVIRKTAKRHGLNTDASFRYERGVDPSLGTEALELAWALLQSIFPDARVSGYDGFKDPTAPFDNRTVKVNTERINALIGEAIPAERMRSILASLDIEVTDEEGAAWTLSVPAYRWDVTREADIAEELLRIYGFNAISFPPAMRAHVSHESRISPELLRRKAADYLVVQGLFEIMNNSLTRAQAYLSHPSIAAEAVVRVLNPLSQDLGVMRPSLMLGGLDAVSYNTKRQNSDVALFEFGRTYHQGDKGLEERNALGIWLAGAYPGAHWMTGDAKVNFFALKGLLNGLFQRFGLSTEEQPCPHEPGEFAGGVLYKLNGQPIATLGWVDDWALKQADLKQGVLAARLDWDRFIKAAAKVKIAYTEPSKFPKVTRDMAFVVNAELPYAELHTCLAQVKERALVKMELFDVYQGKNLPEGHLSYGMRFTFLDPKKTLQDDYVDAAMSKLQSAAENGCQAKLRD
jgi:phenylalanyl-tRNA synthetase beta chain